MPDELTPSQEEASRLLVDHRDKLAIYIRTILRDRDLVEQTLTETMLAIVKAFDQYDPDRGPFECWARGVARILAQANLRKQYRRPKPLPIETIETVAVDIDAFNEHEEEAKRLEALPGCMDALPAWHRRVVEARYYDEWSYNQLSTWIGKSVSSLYVILNRTHARLRECIQRKVQEL